MRTITDEDADAIAERIVARMQATRPGQKSAIVPDAIYTVEEASQLIGMHSNTMTRKLRCGLIDGRRKSGRWRIRGAELLKLA